MNLCWTTKYRAKEEKIRVEGQLTWSRGGIELTLRELEAKP